MGAHILKHLRVPLSEVAENATDVESSSATSAPGVRTAHGPYCLWTPSAIFPKYTVWRKHFKEGIIVQFPGQEGRQCRARGRRLFPQTGESRRAVPSLGAGGESQARSGAMLSKAPCCQHLLSLSALRTPSIPSVLGTGSTFNAEFPLSWLRLCQMGFFVPFWWVFC